MKMNTPPLPDISLVDFSNTEKISESATTILLAADKLGMFTSPPRSDSESRLVKTAAKEWVCGVEANIDSMSPGDGLTVMTQFDIIHRIGYGIPAKTSYLDRYRLKAFEAYIKGDKTVDQYTLYETVSQEIRRGNTAYYDRPLDWESLCIDRWYRNFRTGRSATVQSDYDIVRQVTALLSADLWAYEINEEAFKRKLIANHRHYLDTPAGIDHKQLHALNALLFSSVRYLNPAEISISKHLTAEAY